MVHFKQIRKLLIIFFVWSGCLWMLGCDPDGECASVFNSSLKVQFLDSGTFEPRNIVFDSVFAIGSDSIFYNADDEGTSLFEVPVNPFTDTTAFVFVGKDRLDSATVDTLVVSYNFMENIVSPLCGVEQIYNNLLVTFTTYDSLVSASDSLLLTNDRNIEIFN